MAALKNKQTALESAQEFVRLANTYGWTYTVRGQILTIKKRFKPGDMDGFRDADMMYYSILDAVPRTREGSDWGTDGGGIGALSAIQSGVFTMNRSGCRKTILRAIEKIG